MLFLPRVDVQEATTIGDQLSRPVEEFSGTGTVLLVEDQPAVRDLMTQLIARAGYRGMAVGETLDPERVRAREARFVPKPVASGESRQAIRDVIRAEGER